MRATRSTTFRFGAVAAVAAVVAALLTTNATASGTTVSLTPTADTLVHASNKTTNYGTSTSLSSYGTPDVEALLRFVLPAAPSGQVLTGASLKVVSTSLSSAGSKDTFSVHPASDSWVEKSVTYTTRPAVSSAVLGTLVAPSAISTAYSFSLDPAQLSSSLGTSTSFAITGSGSDGFFFGSKEAAASSRESLTLTFSPSGPPDTTPPDQVGEVEANVTGSDVELEWNPSYDDVGVVAYDIYRSQTNGFTPDASTKIASVASTDYDDERLPAGDFFYVVTARDAAGNTSTPSAQEQATVAAPPPPPPTAATLTVTPTADTFVHGSNKTTNYGTSSSLQSYGTPDVEGLLKFAVPAAPAGDVLSSAYLQIQTATASSAGSGGTQTVKLTDPSWSETGVTYSTKPAIQPAVLGTLSGPTAVNTRYPILLDEPTINGLLGSTASFALLSTGSDGLIYTSREAAAGQRPSLVLSFASGDPDVTPPSAVTDLSAVTTSTAIQLAWSASTDDRGIAKYNVYRSTTSGTAPSSSTLLGSTTQTSYTDPATALGTFYYVVVAVDTSGNTSPASNEASGTVTALPTVTTIAAFGDSACAPGYDVTASACRQDDVAAVVRMLDPDHVLALGDLQYGNGTISEFTGSWDKTWGPFRSITYPIIGNHEYSDPAGPGSGYFDYWYGAGVKTGPFGDRPLAYYTTMIGSWRFIALNSECTSDDENGGFELTGGCAAGSPEYQWLSNVLANNTASCTLVAYHRPRWSTSAHTGYTAMAPMWDLMASKGVDVVLDGHAHDTEVFKQIGASGSSATPTLTSTGIREFVVGSGGKNLSGFPSSTNALVSAQQARDDTTFGALSMTLRDGSYDWALAPVAGSKYTNVTTKGAFSGTNQQCHGMQ